MQLRITRPDENTVSGRLRKEASWRGYADGKTEEILTWANCYDFF